ncbi:hypothetical protein EDI_057730 [Entamoeba dispar SAW760]|uniref:EF-hand domain-containing protein n=1 Tax=Entamoeba dispar (strain ATCC PRA-260 / SAW760) TaxID=370354 RepID=B0EUF1_ENTDS|nr:uncharacterized protein EDI_057730 [Entamoeba dispar SAW760]EDR21842.1 hypothetical protein EDI_057730 [Entamoeba dispar SAW760]|eukprot:EDR21842.1 hypothetical protein EDI_057730 [Entamoeba dispar SAW760]
MNTIDKKKESEQNEKKSPIKDCSVIEKVIVEEIIPKSDTQISNLRPEITRVKFNIQPVQNDTSITFSDGLTITRKRISKSSTINDFKKLKDREILNQSQPVGVLSVETFIIPRHKAINSLKKENEENGNAYQIKPLINEFPKLQWFFLLNCTSPKQERLTKNRLLSIGEDLNYINKKYVTVDTTENKMGYIRTLLKYFFDKFDRTGAGTFLRKEDFNFFEQSASINEATSLLDTIHLFTSLEVPIDYNIFEQILFNYWSFILYDNTDDSLISLIKVIADGITDEEHGEILGILTTDGISALIRMDINRLPIRSIFNCFHRTSVDYFTINEFIYCSLHLKYFQTYLNEASKLFEDKEYAKMVALFNLVFNAFNIGGKGIDFSITKTFVSKIDKNSKPFYKNLRTLFSKLDDDKDGFLSFNEFIKIFEKAMVFNFKKDVPLPYFEFKYSSIYYKQLLINLLKEKEKAERDRELMGVYKRHSNVSSPSLLKFTFNSSESFKLKVNNSSNLSDSAPLNLTLISSTSSSSLSEEKLKKLSKKKKKLSKKKKKQSCIIC